MPGCRPTVLGRAVAPTTRCHGPASNADAAPKTTACDASVLGLHFLPPPATARRTAAALAHDATAVRRSKALAAAGRTPPGEQRHSGGRGAWRRAVLPSAARAMPLCRNWTRKTLLGVAGPQPAFPGVDAAAQRRWSRGVLCARAVFVELDPTRPRPVSKLVAHPNAAKHGLNSCISHVCVCVCARVRYAVGFHDISV